ncbi:MAG: hypothetical protein DRI46_08025 [Chloroflexi bacterium]|nr:MAG: hypothetical protein DRI46_08025 [Chloroflexota bacterium]
MDTERILGIYDNGGRTFDRYTVVYNEHFTWDKTDGLFVCLGMSGNPFHPQGFAQHSSAMVGPHLGKQIEFTDLPKDCQEAVRNDLAPGKIEKESIMRNQLAYIHDAGHGWLEVSMKEIIALGIQHKISNFSYMAFGSAYLEEDCDMGIYLTALKEKHGESFQFREGFEYRNVYIDGRWNGRDRFNMYQAQGEA